MDPVKFRPRLCSECYATVYEGGELKGSVCKNYGSRSCLKSAREFYKLAREAHMDPVEYAKAEKMPPYDAVENPEHYAQHAIQPIEFIMANNLGYCEANVIKYVCRFNLKNGVEDLKKARNYLNILIEEKERG